MKNEISVSGLLSLTGLFIYLKLLGHLNWSWWFIFAPIWFPIAVASIYVFIILWIKR